MPLFHEGQDKPYQVHTVFDDITERRQAEIALQQAHDRNIATLESIGDGFFSVDQQWRVIYVNEKGARMVGQTRDGMLGHNLWKLFPEAVGSRFQQAYQRAMAEQVSVSLEEFYPPLDTWFEAHAYPAPEGLSVFFADVTERKRREQELAEAKAAAEAANIAKSRFLANISHELRTPMNAILGMVDLALPKQVDSTARDFLQTARESADLLLTLLNDLLDSAKIEAGKLELELAPFSLRRVLNQTTQVLAVRASEKRISFSCHSNIPCEVPDALVGDQVRLRQVLLNLAGNAIKFTESGEVEVSVRVSDFPSPFGRGAGGEGRMEIASPEAGSPHPGPLPKGEGTVDLEFTVRDTGIGIPQLDLERIFHPFAQADATTTRRFGGTGLGLSICSSLVGMMGGHIWVESEVGKGSTFYFTVRLPLATGVPPEPETSFDVSTAAPSKLRLLLVEDRGPALVRFRWREVF